MAQDTAHLLESAGFEPGMPTNVWSTTEHIEGKPQISRPEMGFTLEPGQDKPKNPVIGDSQKQSYSFSATLARYLLAEQCGNIQYFITEPLRRLPQSLSDVVEPRR